MELTPWTLLFVAVLVGIVSQLFLKDIIIVFANAVILYFIAIRINAELTKRKLYDEYLIAGLCSCIVLLLFGNFLPLWWITTALVLTIPIVEGYKWYLKRRISRKI